MGELKDTLNVHLSSTCRGASTVQDVMGRNQVSLLLDLYAYQLMHSLRVLMEYITHQGWSLRKVREQILKIAATVVMHLRSQQPAKPVAPSADQSAHTRFHAGYTGRKHPPRGNCASASTATA